MNKIRYKSGLFTLISISSPKVWSKRELKTLSVTGVSFLYTGIILFVSKLSEVKYFRPIWVKNYALYKKHMYASGTFFVIVGENP